MNKFNLSKFMRLIIVGVIINAIIFILNKNEIINYSNQLDILIVKSFGSLGNSARECLISIPIITLNSILLMYKYSDYVIRDINVNGKYIFTRTSKRKYWILNRYLEVIQNIILYYFVILSLYIILGLIYRFEINNINNFINIILKQYIILILVNVFIITITNLIGFKISAISSFSIVYSIYIGNLIMLFFLKDNLIGKIISFTPFGASVTAWNNSINSYIVSEAEWCNYDVINCNILYLMLFITLLIIINIIFQRNIIKNKDLL